MEGFLGEFEVNLGSTPFKDFGPKEWSLYFIERYGQIDGSHHKQWVIDVVARILLGAEIRMKEARWSNGYTEYREYLVNDGVTETYEKWVVDQMGEYDDESEEYEYGYDIGISP